MQIYFEISGYSEMALGLARIFGVILPRNFIYPYISRSVSEFWQRWHGTGWTFIVWGALHGGALVIYHMLTPLLTRLHCLSETAGAMPCSVG